MTGKDKIVELGAGTGAITHALRGMKVHLEHYGDFLGQVVESVPQIWSDRYLTMRPTVPGCP